jgi:hypothetical protein
VLTSLASVVGITDSGAEINERGEGGDESDNRSGFSYIGDIDTCLCAGDEN